MVELALLATGDDMPRLNSRSSVSWSQAEEKGKRTGRQNLGTYGEDIFLRLTGAETGTDFAGGCSLAGGSGG